MYLAGRSFHTLFFELLRFQVPAAYENESGNLVQKWIDNLETNIDTLTKTRALDAYAKIRVIFDKKFHINDYADFAD